jgi:CshA-type fibril repeat protein
VPLIASSLKLCASNETAPNCTQTGLTVANQGTYSVNPDGTVSFDPLPTFTGTATAVNYQVSDTQARTTGSTITPTINSAPLPVASPDSSSGPINTAQFQSVLANDTNNVAALDASSVKLCKLEAPADSAPNCTLTSLSTVDGFYSVDTTSGVVTFIPVAGFFGEATAVVTYSVTNLLGFKTSATYTPTVLAPDQLTPVVIAPQSEVATLARTGFTASLLIWGVFLVAVGSLVLLATSRRLGRQ